MHSLCILLIKRSWSVIRYLEYTISATYPKVGFGSEALMGVRGIADDINNSIDTTIKSIFADFEKEVSDIPPEARQEQEEHSGN